MVSPTGGGGFTPLPANTDATRSGSTSSASESESLGLGAVGGEQTASGSESPPPPYNQHTCYRLLASSAPPAYEDVMASDAELSRLVTKAREFLSSKILIFGVLGIARTKMFFLEMIEKMITDGTFKRVVQYLDDLVSVGKVSDELHNSIKQQRLYMCSVEQWARETDGNRLYTSMRFNLDRTREQAKTIQRSLDRICTELG